MDILSLIDLKIKLVDEDEETSNVSTELKTEQDSPFETLNNMEYNPHLLNNLLEDLL